MYRIGIYGMSSIVSTSMLLRIAEFWPSAMNEPMKSDDFFWLVHAIIVLILVKTQTLRFCKAV